MFIIRLAAEALALSDAEKKSISLNRSDQLEHPQETESLKGPGWTSKRSFSKVNAAIDVDAFELPQKRPFKPSDLTNKPSEEGLNPKGTILYDLLSGRENLHTASLRSQLILRSPKDTQLCAKDCGTIHPVKRRKRVTPVRISPIPDQVMLGKSKDIQGKSQTTRPRKLDHRSQRVRNSISSLCHKRNHSSPSFETSSNFRNQGDLIKPGRQRYVAGPMKPQLLQAFPNFLKTEANERLCIQTPHSYIEASTDQPLDLSPPKQPAWETFGSRSLWRALPQFSPHSIIPIKNTSVCQKSKRLGFTASRSARNFVDPTSTIITHKSDPESENVQKSLSEYDKLLQHFMHLIMSPFNLAALLSANDIHFPTSLSQPETYRLAQREDCLQSTSPSTSDGTSPSSLPQHSPLNHPLIEGRKIIGSEHLGNGSGGNTSPCSSTYLLSESSGDCPDKFLPPRSTPKTLQNTNSSTIKRNTRSQWSIQSPVEQTVPSSPSLQQILSRILPPLKLTLTESTKQFPPPNSGSHSRYSEARNHGREFTTNGMPQNDPTIQRPQVQTTESATNQRSGLAPGKLADKTQEEISHQLYSSVRRWIDKLGHLLKQPEDFLLDCLTKFSILENPAMKGSLQEGQQCIVRCCSNIFIELINTSRSTRLLLVRKSWHQLFAMFAFEENIDIVSFTQLKLERLLEECSNPDTSTQGELAQRLQRTPGLYSEANIQLQDTVKHLTLLYSAFHGMKLSAMAFVLIRMTLLLAGGCEESAENELFYNTETAIMRDLNTRSREPMDSSLSDKTQLNTAINILRRIRQEPIRVLFRDFLEEPIESILCRLIAD